MTEVGLFISNKKDDLNKRLYDFGEYLRRTKAKRKIDLVAIEQDSVSRNHKTVRMLSYFESVAIRISYEWKAEVILLAPSTARKHALGNGALKKEDVYETYRKKYKLRAFGDGGNDQADAICVGIAAGKLLQSKLSS